MASITIRDLDEGILQRLKAKARANGRSMEGEARRLLTEGVQDTLTPDEFIREVSAIHKRMGNPAFPESAPLIREDREAR
jgi:plasmid stability protein